MRLSMKVHSVSESFDALPSDRALGSSILISFRPKLKASYDLSCDVKQVQRAR